MKDTRANVRGKRFEMLDRLEQMEQRYNDLQSQFALPEVLNDHEKYSKVGKALREIETPVEKYRELKQARQGLVDAKAMLTETDITSTFQRCCSAKRVYMRKTSAANSEASSPPVPARISRITFFSSDRKSVV